MQSGGATFTPDEEIELDTEETAKVTPDGWQGTPPAEGTRRKLILDTIEGFSARLISGQGGSLTTNSQLELADAIEGALLRIVDQGATPESGSPASVAMDLLDDFEIPRTRDGAILTIADRVTVLADYLVEARRGGIEQHVQPIHSLLDEAGIRRADDEGQPDERVLTLQERVEILLRYFAARQETIDGLASTVSMQAEQLDTTRGRDDAWVASLVHRVAGAVLAGEPSGVACRRLLEEVGVRSLCRHHGEEELAKGVASVKSDDLGGKAEMPEGLRHSERELWLRGDPDVRVLLDRISRLRSDQEAERLLEQREEARTREGRFAEERDCAFALLRWLLPVTVAKRID